MNPKAAKPPHILFLFSDTGGGHRSAAEAIIEALCLEYGERISTQMVDIFKEYAPQPFNRMGDFYSQIVRVPSAWGFGWRLSNGHRRARLLTASYWPYVYRKVHALVERHPSDMVVSVHPLATAPVLRALGRERPPFITVVTDLVSTHALWYHRRTDLCIVPTQPAYERALFNGLRKDQLIEVGLPVAERFCQPIADKMALREKLGWPVDKPVILLIGGGDGMGPLERTAQAIANAKLDTALVVVTGRNRALKKRLEEISWPIPTLVYGFVRDMPDFMQAADMLVTKAGPGTISEAFNAGLPLILYSRLPGQEDGNVTYVTENKAGYWAPEPESVVKILKTWIEKPEKRQQAAEAARRLARPNASRKIAHILAANLGVE